MKVWLVTGSGNGLGRDIVEAALAAGDCVVAGARRPDELDTLMDKFGQRISPFKLDVRDEVAAQAAVDHALSLFGRLDVLVNNAGYQRNAPFEQLPADEFRDVIETCLFGVVNTTRAAVPIMRKQKSGYILQISSIGGRVTIPGNAPYHAAKWAVGGFSDSIAAEVAPFGVKICTLEPGGMRTSFAKRAFENLPVLIPEYETSVGAAFKALASSRSGSQNDPKKVADLIVALTNLEYVPQRLIIGEAAEAFVNQAETVRAQEAAEFRALTLSTGLEVEPK